MVAIVSGNGLGLFNTSLTQLGLGFGSSGIGQSRGGQYVNIATGNLMLQDRDEHLFVRGFDSAFLRTYNSRGKVAGAGQDGFVTGYERRVSLTGIGGLNTATSTMTLTTGDGQALVFAYSGTTNKYVATGGDGAHDTLVWNGTQWTYTEGSSRREELYESHAGTGRLVRIRNLRSDPGTPAQFDIGYDAGGRVISVTSVDGAAAGSQDAILFSYDAAGKLTAVTTREGGVTRYQLAYTYDSLGRLASVINDLTPDGSTGAWGASNDTARFRTVYSYVSATDATDLRIAAVATSDGVNVAYTYEADGAGGWRVKTLTEGSAADGSTQLTTFSYFANYTNVTLGSGANARMWTYVYDNTANRQLTAVYEPAVDGLRTGTFYAYNASGDVTQVRTERGGVVLAQTDSTYDANGNVLSQWARINGASAASTLVQRTYDANNQVLTETQYTGVDTDGPGAGLPTGTALVTRFVYDSSARLRYVIDAAGGVRELAYGGATSGNAIGQLTVERQYLDSYVGDGTYSLADLNAFATTARKANSTFSCYNYDAKGRLQQEGHFATVNASGLGIFDANSDLVQYRYDAQGLLLQRVVIRGANRWTNVITDPAGFQAGSEITDYTYDGMGRALSVIQRTLGTSTDDASTLVTTNIYFDSLKLIRVTYDSGLVRNETRNAAGQVVSIAETDGASTRTTQTFHDTTGRLRCVQDSLLGCTYYFYNAAGQLTGEVDATGAVIEYVRDGRGLLLETIRYAARVDTSAWLSGATVGPTDIAAIRPTAWGTGFDALPIAGLNTSYVNNAAYPNMITLAGGRLVFTPQTTVAYPSIQRTDLHALADGTGYRAEVTTGAAQANSYLMYGVQNNGAGGAARRAAVWFRNGNVYLNTLVGTTSTNTLVGTTAANTAYVVETRTREGRIEFCVYAKNGVPPERMTFSVDANSADWGATRLIAYGLGGQASAGDPIYLDNLTELDARFETRTYDGLGRLATQTDAMGLVTTYAYDGLSRLLSTTVSRSSDPAATPRVTSYSYDAAGRLAATVDAGGFRTEHTYDAAGRLVRTFRFANANLVLDPARDQSTRYFYDGRGNLVAELSAEGTLTEFVYDEANHQRGIRQYANLATGVAADATLATIKLAVGTTHRLTQRTFNSLGQLATELDAEGTVTRYTYDEAGRHVRTEFAQGTNDVREDYRRYDVFGNLIGELTGEQVVRATAYLATLGKTFATATAAELDGAYARGTVHAYDVLGRRTESIDERGNKTWYFYDALGRQTFTVRGVDGWGTKNAQGEVTELRYSAFGEVTDTLAYTARLSEASHVTLTRASIQNKINVLTYAAASDTRRQFVYDDRGQLGRSIDSLGTVNAYTYTAFGERRLEQLALGTTDASTIQHTYDIRGLETSRIDGLGSAAERTTSQAYDAFGRITSSTDGRLNVTTYTWDRLGRQVTRAQVVGSRTETWTTAYDAFSRTVSLTDARGNTTLTAYDDTARSVTVTTAENVVTTSVHDRHGQTISIVTAAGTSTFTYDDDGHLLTSQAPGLAAAAQAWTNGLLSRTTDASGRQVDYTYDAVGRLVTRIEDPTGSAFTTTYAYDGQGRQVTVTDAGGRVVGTQYDVEGRVVEVAVDPAGLNLRTRYTWDAQGRQLSVTEGFGSANPRQVRYTYDALGRRTSEILEAGTADFTTSYAYDDNDNMVARTDALGAITRYTYDAANRCAYVVGPTGAVTRYWYNANGQVTAVRQYGVEIDASALAGNETAAQMDTLVSALTQYTVQATLYDRDGRVRLGVDRIGSVVETSYDASGRVVGTRAYATAVVLDAAKWALIQAGTALLPGAVVPPGGDPPPVVPTANDALDLAQYTVYDAAGRARFIVDNAGNLTEQRFDAAGRVMQTLRYTVPITNAFYLGRLRAGTAALADFDAFVTANQGSTQRQMALYDAAGRLRFTSDNLGNIVENRYDATGNVVEVLRYTVAHQNPAVIDYFRNGTATVASMTGFVSTCEASALREMRVFDAAGRARFVVDNTGGVTEYRYDAVGRVLDTLHYTVAVDSTLLGAVRLRTATIGSFDAFVADNVGTAQRQSTVYDIAGRARFSVDNLGGVTEQRYDAAGRVVHSLRYTVALTNAYILDLLHAGTATPANLDAFVDLREATAQRQVFVYDDAGRLRFTADTTYAVTETLYNGIGQVYGTRRYAAPANTAAQALLDGGTATVDALQDQLVASDALDARVSYVYDDGGRVRFTVDGLGNVTETRYNGVDEAIQTIRFAEAFTDSNVLAKIRAGTALPSDFTAWVNLKVGAARNQLVIHDAAGRVRFVLDCDSSGRAIVTERSYDGTGQLTAEIRYGKTVPWASYTAATLVAAIDTADGELAANNRQTRYAYDLAGRVRFIVDDLGAVTEQVYNALGQVLVTRQYTGVVSVATASEANVLVAVSGQTGMRTITNTYDLAGRLKTVKNTLNYLETYNYDAAGQRTSRVDRLGQTWYTDYDLAGRVKEERTPTVWVGRFDAAGNFFHEQKSVITRFTYDSTGNVLTRTENAGATLVAEQRKTTYQYDLAGRQVRTIFPDAGLIVGGTLVASGAALPEVNVTIDALGRAVVQKDVLGNFSYKVYDALGRVAFDVDGEGYVTGYAYNSFGEQTGLTRYAARLDTGISAFAGWTAGNAISLAQAQASLAVIANGSLDRTVTTSYDLLGRRTSVVEPTVAYVNSAGNAVTGAPTTAFAYDAYGQLVKESVLLEAGVWADTYHYFDELGRETMTVDAEGYVTTKAYDALGQVIEVREWARAIPTAALSASVRPANPPPGDAASGYDRLTTFAYDALGRKLTDTVRHLNGTQYAAGNGLVNAVTGFTYDAGDRMLTTTVDGVLTATVNYDALGRTINVREADRLVLVGDAEARLLVGTASDLTDASLYETAAAYSTMAYDAFGNTVRQIRYANGWRAGTFVADANRDQVSYTRYDWQGRAVAVVDADGNKRYAAYDAADHVVHQWYALSGSDASRNAIVHQYYTYDDNGQQLTSSTWRAVNGAAGVQERLQQVQYNAFGEIVRKGSNLANAALYVATAYDNAGRMVSTNQGGGTPRTYGYNLAGHQVREQRVVRVLVGGNPVDTNVVYRQVTDRLGRVVQSILPSHVDALATTSNVLRTLDRWGNVLAETDPRGFRTTWEYNDRNQKVREVGPRVAVVGIDGLVTWQSPETRWGYDALGRLFAVRDANGHVDQSTYNAAGQLTATDDSLGADQLQAYDALGNARMSQNQVGYLTFQDFDRSGRIVAQGDYLPGDAGVRGRTELQAFGLNEDGQRITVTNALGQTVRYDYDAEGKLVRSETAAGVRMFYGYDLFGNKNSEINGLNAALSWTYDAFGRVTAHEDLQGCDYQYTYAVGGQLVTDTTGGWGGTRDTSYYANGLVRKVTEGLNWYLYEYDANGNRTLEETRTTDGNGTVIHQRTRMVYDSHNRLVRVTSENIDPDTHLATEVILDVRYGYDLVGNRRVVVADTGYGTGINDIVVGNGGPLVIGQPQAMVVRSGYASEIRLRASDVFQDPEYGSLTFSALLASGAALPAWLVFQNLDAKTGELVFQVNASAAHGNSVSIRLKADDGPNESYVDFTISADSAAAATPVRTLGVTVLGAVAFDAGTASSTRNFEASWYTYDAEDRVEIFNGQLVGGVVSVVANEYKSYQKQYDEAGREVAERRYYADANGSQWAHLDSAYTLRGQLQAKYFEKLDGAGNFQGLGNGGMQSSYTYDNAGRMLDSRNYYKDGTKLTYRIGDQQYLLHVSGWLINATVYGYDADGRTLTQTKWGRGYTGPENNFTGWVLEHIDTGGNIYDDRYDLRVLDYKETEVDYTQPGDGYDAAGNVLGYEFRQTGDSSTASAHTFEFQYDFTYQKRDSYLETKVEGNTDDITYRDGKTDSTYDAFGRRVTVTEQTLFRITGVDDPISKRHFAYDASGGILSRQDWELVDGNYTQAHEIDNSHKLGNPTPDLIDSTTWFTTYTKAQREAVVALSKDNRFAYANGQLIASVNQAGGKLDALNKVTGFSTGRSTSTVTVQEGDTLQSVAQRVYGNEEYWYILATANSLGADDGLVEGTQLKVPSLETNKNDSKTFKPYDPNEIIGPTTPNLPYIEPPPASCGTVGMIIMIVVAIVVTIYTAGAAATVLGPLLTGTTVAAGTAGATMAAGMAALTGTMGAGMAGVAMASAAIGGFVGSVMSQVVGMAMGNVQHFSLRQAVGAGIGAGLTAGVAGVLGEAGTIGRMFGEAQWARVAAVGAASSMAAYAGNRIAGVEDTHFSWRAIAASAVTSVVTRGVNKGLAKIDAFANASQFTQDFVSGTAGGIVSLHVRKAFGFNDKVDYGTIAASAFGNAVANGFVRMASGGTFMGRRLPSTRTGNGADTSLASAQEVRGVPGTALDPAESTSSTAGSIYPVVDTDPTKPGLQSIRYLVDGPSVGEAFTDAALGARGTGDEPVELAPVQVVASTGYDRLIGEIKCLVGEITGESALGDFSEIPLRPEIAAGNRLAAIAQANLHARLDAFLADYDSGHRYDSQELHVLRGWLERKGYSGVHAAGRGITDVIDVSRGPRSRDTDATIVAMRLEQIDSNLREKVYNNPQSIETADAEVIGDLQDALLGKSRGRELANIYDDTLRQALMSHINAPPPPPPPRASITFQPGSSTAFPEYVSAYSLDLLSLAVGEIGDDAAQISSTRRTPYHQARIMFDGAQRNLAYQQRMYGSRGDEVLAIYSRMRANGEGRGATIAAMEAHIQSYFDQGIYLSNHLDPAPGRETIDIAPSSVSDGQALHAVFQRYQRDGLIGEYLSPYTAPNQDPAFHVVIIQPPRP
jgi:YD repeat-containing protein